MVDFSILHSQQYYNPGLPELREPQLKFQDLNFKFNKIQPSDIRKKTEILKELFASFGEGSYIETPFFANWGGHHVFFGKHVYANYNLTLVDDTYIYVDDYTQIGPNVTLVTATHPVNNKEREKGLQINKPIKIGRNCFIGAGTTVLPGVTIGNNVVIGAASLVNKDIPDNTTALGSPAKVIYYHS